MNLLLRALLLAMTMLGASPAFAADEQTLAAARQRLANAERQSGAQNAAIAPALHAVGDNLWNLKRYNESLPYYERAADVREKRLGLANADTIYSLSELGIAYFQVERYKDAIATREKLLQAQQRLLGADHADMARTLHGIGDAYWNQKLRKESVPYYERALAIRDKRLGPEHKDTLHSVDELKIAYKGVGRMGDYARMAERQFRLRERQLGGDNPEFAKALHEMGDTFWNARRYDLALPYYQRALALREQKLGAEHPDTLFSASELGIAERFVGRYREALALHERVLKAREKALGPNHLDVAKALHEIADDHWWLDDLAAAAAAYERAMKIREKTLGPEHLATATSLADLGNTYRYMARYADSEAVQRRALAIREKVAGANALVVASSLSELAMLYRDQARFAEAEAALKRVVDIDERAGEDGRTALAAALHDLGIVYRRQGRFAEAETHYKRAQVLYETHYGPESKGVIGIMGDLASLYSDQGRADEAETLLKKALAIREKKLPADHHDVALSVSALGTFYWRRGRQTEAEPLLRRALAIMEQARGKDHPSVASRLNNLANLCLDQDRYDEAEPLLRRAIDIWEKAYGPEHPDTALGWYNLSGVHRWQERYDEAEAAMRKALAIYEKTQGPDHPDVADCLMRLTYIVEAAGRKGEIGPLLDRAAAIGDRGGMTLANRFQVYYRRASVAWDDGLKSEALADLRKAMAAAESLRTTISGAEQERAQAFAKYAQAFEKMVEWQTTLGDMNEALAAIERSRARSLLDEMHVGGADLQIGRSSTEREQFRRKEAEMKTRITALEAELAAAAGKPAAEKAAIETKLRDAREALYGHYRDERNSNPVYRNLLTTDAGPPQLSQVQRQLTGDGNLLFVYLLGENNGYLMTIRPGAAKLVRLSVGKDDAKTLGIKAGPLTAATLKGALVNKQKTGVLQQLSRLDTCEKAASQLAALWNVLVPEAEREELTEGKVKRLIVVPDGPLALLPFETLVVAGGERPRTLLDVGSAILYGPSVTVLNHLAGRRPAPPPREALVTVGDPRYELAEAPGGGDRSASTSYVALGGKLTPLPYSGWESTWVEEAFAKCGMKAKKLTGTDATEANVRREVAGRRVIHLACHGLTDQTYGNFFGALALAPGKDPNDPRDDGMLTLPEIYELDLRMAELAILSACETNYGPEQRGEGVWTLSRGFLVAGSRRVLASNWLVDDEAAASMISYFCGIVAAAEKEGKQPDYAAALQAAKRYIRQQDKWRRPYYWGSVVLVGPQ